jgi:hypothetical protein
MMFDSKVAYESAPSFTNALDIVDKQYVDDITAYGVTWKQPVSVLIIKGEADTEPAGPNPGDAWLVSTTWSGYSVGTIVEWDGDSWVVIAAGSGDEPPNGTRVAVAASATTPFDGNDYALATYSTATSDWSFDTPEDGDAVLVSAGYYSNRAFVYDTTSHWIQIAGPGQYTAGSGIDISGQEISVLLSAGPPSDGQYPGLVLNGTDGGLAVLPQPGGGLSVSAAGTFTSTRQNVSALRVYDAVAAANEPSPFPDSGLTYLIASGTGNWTGVGAVTAGDLLTATDNGWVKVVAASGGFTPANTRIVVSEDAIDEFSGFKKHIMVATGASNAPADWEDLTPVYGDVVIVTTVYGRGLEWVYTGSWSDLPLLKSLGGLTRSEEASGLSVKLTAAGLPGIQFNPSDGGLMVKPYDGISVVADGVTIVASTDIKVDAYGVSVAETYPFHRPVHVVYMITDLDQGGSVPANPINGGTYIVDNWGGTYTDGDVYQYVGGNWVKLYATAGSGKPPDDLRVLVHASPEAGSSFAGHGKQLGLWDGVSWNFQPADDGDILNVAPQADDVSPVGAFWGTGGSLQFDKSIGWAPLITKFKEQQETNWPAATTTWALTKLPAQISNAAIMDGALAVYYNGQRLLRTASSGGGQGTYYVSGDYQITFDFTPVTGSTMEAVIGYWLASV